MAGREGREGREGERGEGEERQVGADFYDEDVV